MTTTTTTFECLPNEILVELFEKYINGVDLINAFAFQLNHRFDQLIRQCYRLRFNFIHCGKDQFQLCMGLLPAYIDRIEEIALSDDRAPGQVFAFLTLHPSLDRFTRLRRFYCNADEELTGSRLLHNALKSVQRLTLDAVTLRIKEEEFSAFERDEKSQFNDWSHLKSLLYYGHVYLPEMHVFPNLRSLIITNRTHGLETLDTILENAPRLTYFNIKVTTYYGDKCEMDMVTNPPSSLKKLILDGDWHSSIHPKKLQRYLCRMPKLHYLEIVGGIGLIDAAAWEEVITSYLPCLTYLTLFYSRGYGYRKEKMQMKVQAFQTPFWIERVGFHVVLGEAKDDREIESFFENQSVELSIINTPVTESYVGPVRPNIKPENPYRSLYIRHEFPSFVCNHRIDQLKRLVLESIEDPLYESIRNHIPAIQIQHLDFHRCWTMEQALVGRVLSLFPNLRSLRISGQSFFKSTDPDRMTFHRMESLNLSEDEHEFGKKAMKHIHAVCPHLKHLSIRPKIFASLAYMQNYLPSLRSIRLHRDKNRDDPQAENNRGVREWFHERAIARGFYFRCAQDGMVIWIDRKVFKDENWRSFDGNDNHSRYWQASDDDDD